MLQRVKFRLYFALFLVGALICSDLVLPVAESQQVGGKGADLRTISKLPSKEKRWALIIGISNYEDGNLTDLKGMNDARALKDALVRYAGFLESQVILLGTDELRERQPTRENIIKRLSNLKNLVPKDGLFLFSFSGHGIESNGQAFLIPSTMSYDDDIEVLKETAVSVDYIKRQIKLMNVQQVLVLLDACRNDPANSRSDSKNPLTPAYTKGFDFDVRNKEVTAFATLYATSVGERAYEYAEKEQGYFTWAIVEALKGAAANEQGEVTLSQLLKYVEEVVPREVRKDLGGRKTQQPFAVIEGYKADQLVLAVTSAIRRDDTQTKSQRDRDWAVVDKQNKVEIQMFLAKYKDDFEATLTLKRLEAKEPKVGDGMTLTLPNGAEMVFVYIPPGSFKMGSNNDRDPEKPAHMVNINKGFWLGQTEVTQGQWATVMGNNPSEFQGKNNRLGNDLNLPVELVSWNNVQKFIQRLNAQQNRYIYRLPTEAEWEYAARAETTDEHGCQLDSMAWHYHNAGEKLLTDDMDLEKLKQNKNQPHPVGQKLPNAWGLYDIRGNVDEWVNSKYKPYPYNPNDGRENISDDGSWRVLRGGSWFLPTTGCLATDRSWFPPYNRFNFVGFRLVVTLKT